MVKLPKVQFHPNSACWGKALSSRMVLAGFALVGAGCASSTSSQTGAAGDAPSMISQASSTGHLATAPVSGAIDSSELSLADWLRLSDANEAIGLREAAIAILDSAILVFPTHAPLRVKRAWLKYDLGDKAGALAEFNQVASLFPSNADAYYGRARVHLFNDPVTPEDLATAVRNFDQALELRPDFTGAMFDRAYALFTQRNYAAAIAGFVRCIERGDYRISDALNYTAEAHRRLKQYSAALANATQAIALDSSDAKYFVTRGKVWSALRNFTLALKDFDRAVSLERSAMNIWARGEFFLFAGEYEKSVADLSEVISLKPTLAGAFLDRASARVGAGDLANAVADCTESLRLNPGFPEPYWIRYGARYRQGDIVRARADLEMLLKLKPDYVPGLIARGDWNCNTLGKEDAAASDFDRALALAPTNADASRGRGVVWIRLKQPEKALPYFTRALEHDPQNAGAYNAMAEAHMDMGQWVEAMAVIERGEAAVPGHASFHYSRALIAFRGFKDYARTIEECDKFLLKDGWAPARQLREAAIRRLEQTGTGASTLPR